MLTHGLLTGTPDGTTTVFTLPEVLISGSEQIFRQGIAQQIVASSPGIGQVIVSGTTVTFPAAPNAPLTGDRLTYYGEAA